MRVETPTEREAARKTLEAAMKKLEEALRLSREIEEREQSNTRG